MKVCSLCYRCHEDSELFSADDGGPISESLSGSPGMVPGYSLEILLSSGITGNRFRARQNACGSPCVISVHAATDEQRKSAFLTEAKLAETMFDPNLAAVYEAGELPEGQCFVVTEDAPEKSLREYIHTNRDLSLLKAIEIVRGSAEAVSSIHLKGLAHRAIRPENILVSAESDGIAIRLQEVDFGGLRAHSVVSNKFLIDSAVDSLRYFAPEQCSGETAGTAADVYSLGVILYEMITGAPPFEAPTAAGVIEKHRSHRPPEIRVDNFELRMLITHTVMEALHKRPEKRQSSANAFARQLRHVEQLASHVSTPPPAITPRPAPRKVVPPVIIEPVAPAAPPWEEPPPPWAAADSKPVEILEESRPLLVEQHVPAPLPTPEELRSEQVPSSLANPAPELPKVRKADVAVAAPLLEDPPKDLGTVIADFMRERSAPALSHFSRLRDRRKKGRSPATKQEEKEPSRRNDTETAKPIDTADAEAPSSRGRVLSAEAAAAQMQAALREVTQLRAKAKPRKVVCKVSEDDVPTEKQADPIAAETEIFALEAPTLPEVAPEPRVADEPLPLIAEAARLPEVPPEPRVAEKSVRLIAEAELPAPPVTDHVVPIVLKPEPLVTVVATNVAHSEPETVHPVLVETKAVELTQVEVGVEPAAAAEIKEPEPQPIAVESKQPEQQPIAAESKKPRPIALEVQTIAEPEPSKEVLPARDVPKRTETPAPPPAAAKSKPVVQKVNADDVGRVTAPIKGPVPDVKPRGIRVSGLQDRARSKAPVQLPEPEEITVVSPASSRFRVPIEPPPAARKREPARRVVPIPSNEAVFVPTILSGRKTSVESQPVHGGSILANYDPAPVRRAIPYRSLAAGSGLLAIIAFFLFANNFLWEDAAIATSGDPAAAASAFTREPRPSTATANPALPISNSPKGKTDRPAPIGTSDDTKQDTTPASLKSSGPAPARTAEKVPEPVRKASAKTAESPGKAPAQLAALPPIIIGQKPRPRRETSNVQPITVRSSGATRPRIVVSN